MFSNCFIYICFIIYFFLYWTISNYISCTIFFAYKQIFKRFNRYKREIKKTISFLLSLHLRSAESHPWFSILAKSRSRSGLIADFCNFRLRSSKAKSSIATGNSFCALPGEKFAFRCYFFFLPLGRFLQFFLNSFFPFA